MSAVEFTTRLSRHDVPEAVALRRLDALARLLDTAVPIPFSSGGRIGVDALLGIIPGIGDAISTAISGYLIYEARNLGMPKHKLLRMALNTGVDGVIGAVPVLGDLVDVFFRANERNIRIIRDHLERDGRMIDFRNETTSR
jgi:hypothetical protein